MTDRKQLVREAEELAEWHSFHAQSDRPTGKRASWHKEQGVLIRRLLSLLPKEGEVVVPVEPTEEQWGGLARVIMLWMDMNSRYTPEGLLEHLRRSGESIPDWLTAEPEMKNIGHSMSKGTRCVIIYKAMIEARLK